MTPNRLKYCATVIATIFFSFESLIEFYIDGTAC